MNATALVAIHQPNFFPWLGYFDKIRRADAFVFLDHVQLQKTGGTWSNRVRVMMNGEPRWLTAPLERAYHGVRRIDEIRFNETLPWRSKLLKTLGTNYRKAPHFSEALDLLEPQIAQRESGLATYNIRTVMTIANALGFDEKRFLRSSELSITGHGTELLIAITQSAGCRTYMCGGGAAGYQDDRAFAAAGIGLAHQDFSQPVYPQNGAKQFVPGLSIIDALMNCGVDGTRRLLCGGI